MDKLYEITLKACGGNRLPAWLRYKASAKSAAAAIVDARLYAAAKLAEYERFEVCAIAEVQE